MVGYLDLTVAGLLTAYQRRLPAVLRLIVVAIVGQVYLIWERLLRLATHLGYAERLRRLPSVPRRPHCAHRVGRCLGAPTKPPTLCILFYREYGSHQSRLSVCARRWSSPRSTIVRRHIGLAGLG